MLSEQIENQISFYIYIEDLYTMLSEQFQNHMIKIVEKGKSIPQAQKYMTTYLPGLVQTLL